MSYRPMVNGWRQYLQTWWNITPAKFHIRWDVAQFKVNKGQRFRPHGVTIDAVDVLFAQLTRNAFAIAKFLLKGCR